jgi:glycine reductase complex component B subunit gamma
MPSRYRVIYCLNQFFGGLGGEDQAYQVPLLVDGARGPGILLERLFPNIEVVATVISGDNYVAEKTNSATLEVISLLKPLLEAEDTERPHILLAGPVFNAGRYGIASGAICRAVHERFKIPAVTAMYPENPAVEEYRKDVFISKAGEDVITMETSLRNMVSLSLKLLQGQEIFPERDGYISQGRRKNYFTETSGAARAIEMLLKKLSNKPFSTEYAMPVFDRVPPAPPVQNIKDTRLALVTSGGIVPHGNPDRIEAANASRFGAYPIEDLMAFSEKTHQTAHGGYDPTFANENPNRVLPLDVVRELESEGAFSSLHDFYYATVGNGTSVKSAEKYGLEIAKLLVNDGVQAVILTST